MAALAAPIGGMIIPIQVSNHSYGQQVGWANGVFGSQAPFGIYNNSASCFDSVATGTGLVIVKSAGNDRDDPAPGLATAAQPADCFTSFAPLAGDCITPGSTAKNVITVGAMDGGDQIAAFSNFGPTDDGRIKPDVVAPGDQSVGMQSIVSLGNAGVRATARFQGTSMAAPAVSGVAALAIQNARALAIPVQSASIKSLLVHTANDVKGTGQATPGPDFATGWGMVDAVAALSYLRRSSLGIPSSTPSATTALAAGIQSGTLLQTGNAGAVTFQFMVRNTAELKVTLGWDDPQPMMLAPPILVNDLDLTLTDPTGQSFEPWMLDPSRPGLAAVQNGGQDQINNIVQVSVPNPSCGVWTATVSSPSGATNLMNGPMMAPSQQNFALMLPTFPRSSFQIDFDGNGRSDIFRANGSEWRFSADGVQGWQHLNVSGIDSQLKFGHFDCDGLTDVFHSHGGKFNVSFGGRTGWTAINNSGVTSGLRLGDFDGDGIADVFRADGSQWWVSLGGSTGWTPLAQSSFESHELRFGDFEGDGITDVFRGDGEDWKVSFGGVGAWTTINVSQFETDEVAFGDFDGDGITDVFRADGEHWWISFSGTGSWQRMAQSETSLPDLEFADFDGDGTTDVFRGNGERWFFSRSAIGPWTGLARSQLEARDVSTR